MYVCSLIGVWLPETGKMCASNGEGECGREGTALPGKDPSCEPGAESPNDERDRKPFSCGALAVRDCIPPGNALVSAFSELP